MKYAIWALGIVVILALVAASQDPGKEERKPPAAQPEEAALPKEPTIHFNRPFQFDVKGKGDLVKIEVGEYAVTPEGDAGIRIKATEGGAEFVLVAVPLSHEEKLERPAAAIYECGEDLANVVFIRPDGKGLCARGSHSGVRVRGAEDAVLKYIFADAQQPNTWGAVPAGAKILRAYPQHFVWTSNYPRDIHMMGYSPQFGAQFVSYLTPTLYGTVSVQGNYVLPLPPGSQVLQVRLMANDMDPYSDAWCCLTVYTYKSDSYVPADGGNLISGGLHTSGTLDWAWRTGWINTPPLSKDSVLNLQVGVPANLKVCFRQIDIVYMPPPS